MKTSIKGKRIGCFWVFLYLPLLAVLLVGCSTDDQYEPPVRFQSDNVVQEIQPERQAEIAPKQKIAPEKPKTEIFEIRETASDNQLKITVNGVKFEKVLNFESSFSTIPFEARENNEFVVVDLTIENVLDDKTQTPVLTLQAYVMDQDGYSYRYDGASIAVDKIYDNQDILPGMKKRGKVAFSVPEDATDLKFFFKFDITRPQTAVFDIK